VQLFIQPPKKGEGLSLSRAEADWRTVSRGTVQHEILEGDRAAAFSEGDHIELSVNCHADAGSLEDPVPYGLAASLEVAEGVTIPIYDEVRAIIAVAVRAAART
jgi:hypothetical protein